MSSICFRNHISKGCSTPSGLGDTMFIPLSPHFILSPRFARGYYYSTLSGLGKTSRFCTPCCTFSPHFIRGYYYLTLSGLEVTSKHFRTPRFVRGYYYSTLAGLGGTLNFYTPCCTWGYYYLTSLRLGDWNLNYTNYATK